MRRRRRGWRYRSARTGRFVSVARALAAPAQHVREAVKKRLP